MAARKKPTPTQKVEKAKDPMLDQEDSFDFAFPDDSEFDAIEPEPEVEEAEEEESDEEEDKKEEKPEFSKEELLRVFDQILFEGTYTETGTIKGKLKFEFRMRTTKDAAEIARRIDKAGFNLMATVDQHVAVLNLAYSLINLRDDDLSSMSPLPAKQGEKSRYDYINDLPSAITAALYDKLMKFDRKVALALLEAQENF